MYRLVLIRHGESQWNLENRFTGWTDVELTEKGVGEAREAGSVLKSEGYTFDMAFSSVLKRANRTLELALESMGSAKIKTVRDWALNERHYGALQGLNKAETAQKFGEEQVLIWRRSYDIPPPALETNDPRYPGNDPLYAGMDKHLLPLTESLKDTVARVVPYWNEKIAPAIKSGRRVIVAAHGNSLRALVKHLDRLDEAAILKLNIPTGIPLAYELDANLKPVSHRYLGDQEKIQAAIGAVANQGKK